MAKALDAVRRFLIKIVILVLWIMKGTAFAFVFALAYPFLAAYAVTKFLFFSTARDGAEREITEGIDEWLNRFNAW